MTQFVGLTKAFKNESYDLVQSPEPYVFQITNSACVARCVVEAIISGANHCPIISENRIGESCEFTVIPYEIPSRFTKADCKRKAMTNSDLWDAVESTKSCTLKESEPFVLEGNQLFDSLAQVRRKILDRWCKTSAQAFEFFIRTLDTKPGTILDLGCGKGLNSTVWLINGWRVVAIDNSQYALELFRKNVLENNKPYLDNGKLSLIHADITAYDFPQNQYDTVLCIDVLPYILPKKMKSLLQKIHRALLPGGHFIGSLALSVPEKQEIEEVANKMGAHLYKEEHLIPAMLEHSGFKIVECTHRFDSVKCERGWVEFIAKATQ